VGRGMGRGRPRSGLSAEAWGCSENRPRAPAFGDDRQIQQHGLCYPCECAAGAFFQPPYLGPEAETPLAERGCTSRGILLLQNHQHQVNPPPLLQSKTHMQMHFYFQPR